MSDPIQRKLDAILNIVLFALVATGIYIFFKYIVGLLMPFIIAFLMVSALSPFIRWLHRHFKINQKFLSVFIIGLLYIAVGWFLFWAVLRIVIVLRDVLTSLPDYYQSTIAPAIMSLWALLDNLIAELPEGWLVGFDLLQDSLVSGLSNFTATLSQRGIEWATGLLNTIPSMLIGLIFTVMLSFFISLQYRDMLSFFRDKLPKRAQDFAINLRSIMGDTVLRYLRAYLIIMSITFVELSVGLFLIGTPRAIGVAAGIALFDALPVFGTGGVMIPWICIELLQGNLRYAFGLAMVYGIITLVRNIIEPKVVGDQLGLNPIVSLMAIYLGLRLFGVFGMIFFPMLVQIVLALYEKGSFRFFSN